MTTFSDDNAKRKSIPIFDGAVMYFPNALAAVAEVSREGNKQHNPGEPLHWARDKSTDQFNTALRHLIDHANGCRFDVDGQRHLAKAAWRVLAALQLDIEAEAREAKNEAMKNIRPIDPVSREVLSHYLPCFDSFGVPDRAVDELLALPQNGSSSKGEDI